MPLSPPRTATGAFSAPGAERPAMLLIGGLLLLNLVMPRAAGRLRQAPAAAAPVATEPAGGTGAGAATHGTAPARETGAAAEPEPVTGVVSFAKRAWTVFSEDRIMSEAAGVTFYVLLSLFPALASLISIYGLFGDPADLDRQLHGFGSMIPGGGMQILDDQIKALAGSSGKALGVGVLIGLLTSLWSANNGIKSLMEALNVVFREKEGRSFIRFTLVAFGFTAGGIAFLIVTVSAVVALPVVLNFVGYGNDAALVLRLVRWPVLLLVLMVGLSATYRFGPDRDGAKWEWITWGAGVAAVGWLVTSFAFSYYVANFGNYNKTYGSLGAVIGFMTWIWISSMVVLMGGALNAELEFGRQRREQGATPAPVAPQEATA